MLCLLRYEGFEINTKNMLNPPTFVLYIIFKYFS